MLNLRKRKFNAYGDGIARFYEKKDGRRNVKDLGDLNLKFGLPFDLKALRQRDREAFAQLGRQLSLKIVVPDNGVIDTGLCVVIDDIIYAIEDGDRDKKDRCVYYYLKEVRKIA